MYHFTSLDKELLCRESITGLHRFTYFIGFSMFIDQQTILYEINLPPFPTTISTKPLQKARFVPIHHGPHVDVPIFIMGVSV